VEFGHGIEAVFATLLPARLASLALLALRLFYAGLLVQREDIPSQISYHQVGNLMIRYEFRLCYYRKLLMAINIIVSFPTM